MLFSWTSSTLSALAVVGTAYVASAIRRRNQLRFRLPSHCMRGRVAVVTGANSGIGRVVAAELSAAGATTVLACRDVRSGQSVAAHIRANTSNAAVSVLPLDLTSPTSVRALAKEVERLHARCDVLVLNAGVMRASYGQVDGIETTFSSNYLGHWSLTQQLLPQLQAAQAASGERSRVVSVASRLEKGAPPLLTASGSLALGPLLAPGGFTLGRAYSVSKVCQIAAALELHRRHSGFLVSAAVTPGMVNTNLSRFLPAWKRALAAVLKPLLLRSPAKGAETVLYAVAAPAEEVGGKYLGDCAEVQPSTQAADPQLASLLWDESERMVEAGTET